MSVPTERNIREKLADRVKTVSGYEAVETRKRISDDATDENFINLVISLNPDGNATAWLITLVRRATSKDDCLKIKTFTYKFERVQEYQDTEGNPDTVDETSYEVFLAHIESVDDMLSAENFDTLGYAVSDEFSIEHSFLDAETDLVTRRWGEGEDSRKAHYGEFIVEVKLTYGRESE